MEFDALMQGVAAKVGLTGFQPGDDGVYAVEIDGMVVRFVEDAEARQIVTLAEVGESPAEGRERLYRVLLEAAYMGQATGGANFAVDSETGNIQLSRTDPLPLMDVESFMAKMDRFVNVLERWRGLLDNFSEVAPQIAKTEAAADEEARQFGSSGFLQV